MKEIISKAQAEIKRLDATIHGRAINLRNLEEEKSRVDDMIRDIRAKAERYSKLEARLNAMISQARNVEAEKKDLQELERVALKKSYVSETS